MLHIKHYLFEKIRTKKIIKYFSDNYGLPEIKLELGIYIDLTANETISIKISYQEAILKIIDKNTTNQQSVPFSIPLSSLKTWLKIFKMMGSNTAEIGEITRLSYRISNKCKVDIVLHSFIGNYVRLTGEDNTKYYKEVKTFCNKLLLKKVSSKKIQLMLNKRHHIKKVLLDDNYALNEEIQIFINKTGSFINLTDSSIQSKLFTKSNDYTYFESILSQYFNYQIPSHKNEINPIFFQPVSIVVPFYNSNNTLIPFLDCINSQQIINKDMNKVQVILIDDGSSERLLYRYNIKTLKNRYSFKIDALRLETNQGIGKAKKIGCHYAENDIIVFADSDILLAANYLLTMSYLCSLIPNGVFVSFKKNIKSNEKSKIFKYLKTGLPNPTNKDDFRITRNIDSNKTGIYKMSGSANLNLLADTNFFKQFGYGRRIGIYDLPSMVVGHNICCNKSVANKALNDIDEFKGWGLEDSYFGANLIANGNFIIPVISTGVYHLDHPPRSGDEKQKKYEFNQNIIRYKNKIHETDNDIYSF